MKQMKRLPTRQSLALVAALALVATLAACEKDTGVQPDPPAGNGAPTATITISHTAALPELSTVEFRASGSDPNGDAVTYAWNFGDGGTATGASATHVYARAGSYNVVMTISDNRGASANVSGTVAVRSLDGLWLEAVPFPEGTYGIEITQQGGRFTGRVISPFAGATGPITGTVNAAGTITYDANYIGFNYTEHFEGRLDATLNRMTGTVRGSNGFRYDPQLVRQP